MTREDAARWLGIERVADTSWRLPVTSGLVSGAGALFGGCAMAAALSVARELSPQPPVWASAHYGMLAPLGTTVDLEARVIASGRTITHLEVVGRVDDRESFTVRAAAGDRPVVHVEGQWVAPPGGVSTPEECDAFDHPVHANTWGERFEWRLARRRDPVADAHLVDDAGDADGPVSMWWVRPLPGDDPRDALATAPVLVDYVTYGVGRALGVPMGGLSVDNVIRIHEPALAEWFLLEVRPEAIAGGFGFGTARLYADGILVATGSQTIVVNGWDWRLPSEHPEPDPATPAP
jgi:acyl-CoA thioesterase-2